MAAMNTKLGKQMHTPKGPIDVHLLRGYLYGEYAKDFLGTHGAQMQDSQRARAYVEHEAELHMSVGMMVSSAFKLPLHQAAATRALSDLTAHERTRFEPQITKLLRDRQAPEPAARKGCFIATAAMGTPLAPEIGILSDFRDDVLLSTAPGRALVGAYERFSPPIAGAISRSATLCTLVRVLVVWPATKLVRWSSSMSPTTDLRHMLGPRGRQDPTAGAQRPTQPGEADRA
jgi:hypothetical protein